jgi:hypothetical protein
MDHAKKVKKSSRGSLSPGGGGEGECVDLLHQSISLVIGGIDVEPFATKDSLGEKPVLFVLELISSGLSQRD